MRRPLPLLAALAACFALAAATPTHVAASQQTGAIEFVARVTSTGGRPEPVRELTFYLLNKSLTDIQKEVEVTEAQPDLEKFIDGLSVSKELKAWMKKHHMVELAGADFIKNVSVDDVLNVPEFFEAYLQHNSNYSGMGFPSPKYRPADKQANPQKYEKQHAEYMEALRKWITGNPQSVDGMEVHLDAINPGQRWAQQQSELRHHARKLTLDLAQTRYLAAKTDTDLEGRGSFSGVPPGDYWLGTLDIEAVSGDVRLRWDTAVNVRAGQVTRLELSNLNALQPQRPTH